MKPWLKTFARIEILSLNNFYHHRNKLMRLV